MLGKRRLDAPRIAGQRALSGRRTRYRPAAAGSCCAPAATPHRSRGRPSRWSRPAHALTCPRRTRSMATPARWGARTIRASRSHTRHDHKYHDPDTMCHAGHLSRKMGQSHFLMAMDTPLAVRARLMATACSQVGQFKRGSRHRAPLPWIPSQSPGVRCRHCSDPSR
jgi:hypothetical protein